MSGIIKPGEALASPEEKLKVAVENIGQVVYQHEEALKIVMALILAVKPVIDQIQVKQPEKKEEAKVEEKKEEKKDK